jgi:outer membrane protein OmpA-like peptidoglycan-associated protein
VSDSKKVPSLPPDDFSKTTPNIPRADDIGSSDWEKTNYNSKFAPQPPADDWGKTVANMPPVKDEPDFNKTYMPAGQNPKAPDWGVTDANIKLPNHDFSDEQQENPGNRTNYGATSPFIQLPDAERAKYQNLPPTPTQAAEQKKEDDKQKKSGIPSWFWAVGGLLTMFFFAIIVILLVYFFFLRPTGFEVVVESAPPRSEVWIDGTRWSVTEGDGTLKASGLKSNELKKLEIRNSNFTCDPRDIEGKDGETVTIKARCTQTGGLPPPVTPTPQIKTSQNDDCQNIRLGEFDKAERCANAALDALPSAPNYTADQLTKALNIFIINFDKKRFNIPSSRMKFLERAATFIKNLPPSTILEVGGHTDSDGSDADNQTLSENRAKSVKEALVKFGVRSEVLQTKGYGEGSPKTTNNTEEGKFFNRRIEYSVIKN